ncbi:MAG: glycosyltransferase [Pseudomonadota bacterium]
MNFSPEKVANCAVLLAAHEGERWIEEQIWSILVQHAVNVHVFISVDPSPDRTLDLCRGIAATTTNVTVLPTMLATGSAAANFFRLIRDVDMNGFDFIALSDQDDIWHVDKLHQAVSKMTAGGYQAFSSDVMAFWESGKRQLVKKSYPQTRIDFLFEAAGPGSTYVLTHGAMTNFRDWLPRDWHGQPPPAHDWLIYAYARANRIPWHIDDQPLLDYRQHPRNALGANMGLAAYLRRARLLCNGWYRAQVARVKALVDPDGTIDFSLDRAFLIRNAPSLRRRPRDAGLLALMVLMGLF